MKDAAAILNLCRIVRDFGPQGPLVIVVSAMGKTTNALEEIYDLAYRGGDYSAQLQRLEAFHHEAADALAAGGSALMTEDVNEGLRDTFDALEEQLAAVDEAKDYDEQYDQVVSFGELLASLFVAHVLNDGSPTSWLDCRPLIRTDENWREGKVEWATTEAQVAATLPPLLATGIVVTQGFLGGTADGRTTTLGREGSDYTAAILAYCLRAESVTIWKDVAGLLNADPKIFPETVRYPEISYRETIEMAYYGASVIHPKTLKPLADRNIPLRVKSFLDPEAAGTLIHDCQHPTSLPFRHWGSKL